MSYIVPPAEAKDAAKEDKKDDDEKDPAAEATLAEAMRGLRITQLGTLAAAIKKLEAKKEEPVVVEKGGKGAFDAGAALGETKARYTALLDALKAECAAASADEQRSPWAATSPTRRGSAAAPTWAPWRSSFRSPTRWSRSSIRRRSPRRSACRGQGRQGGGEGAEGGGGEEEGAGGGAAHKALALADLHAAAADAHPLTTVDAAVAALHKWAKPRSTRSSRRWHRAHGRHATALSVLTDSLAKEKTPPSKESIAQQLEIVEALGWRHWADAGKAALLVKFPAKYPPVFSRLD